MKTFFTTAFLLLISIPSIAQTLVPTLQHSNDQTAKEPKPYEGRPVASLEFRGNFYISEIRFEGNTTVLERVLREQLLIHEGDLYNESLVEKSVSRLNSLGLFPKLTAEGVLIKANDHQLTFTIQLDKSRATKAWLEKAGEENNDADTKKLPEVD